MFYDAASNGTLSKPAEKALFRSTIAKHRMQPMHFDKYIHQSEISLTPAGIIKFYCFNGLKKANRITSSKMIVLWFCYQVMKPVPVLGTKVINSYYKIFAKNRDKKKGGEKCYLGFQYKAPRGYTR